MKTSFVVALLLPVTLSAQTVTLEMLPPVVVESTPQSGTINVDPNTTELRVTFSKEMKIDSWSCIQFSKESWPGLSPRGFTKNKRTFVATLSLESGRTYAIGINDARYQNFKDASGNSAMPFIILFRTRE